MDADTIIDRLRGSAVWREAEAAAEADLVAERKAAKARVEAAEKAHSKALPGLLRERDKAQARRDAAWTAFLEAEASLGDARNALAAASGALDAVRNREHGFLRATAPERVAAFRGELEELWQAHRYSSVVTEGGGGLNILTDEVKGPTRWNKPSLDAFMATILREIQRCPDLALIPDPADLDAEIKRIRASIPDPDRMVKVGRAA